MILWNKFLNHNLLLSPAPQTAESALLETPLYPAKLNTNQFITQTLQGGLRSVKSVDVLQSSWAQPTPETSALLSFPPSRNISMMHWTADPAGHTCEVQSAVPSVAPGASTLFQLHHRVKMKGESRGRLQRERKERRPTGGKLRLCRRSVFVCICIVIASSLSSDCWVFCVSLYRLYLRRMWLGAVSIKSKYFVFLVWKNISFLLFYFLSKMSCF